MTYEEFLLTYYYVYGYTEEQITDNLSKDGLLYDVLELYEKCLRTGKWPEQDEDDEEW